jgi:hypothetical protein
MVSMPLGVPVAVIPDSRVTLDGPKGSLTTWCSSSSATGRPASSSSPTWRSVSGIPLRSMNRTFIDEPTSDYTQRATKGPDGPRRARSAFPACSIFDLSDSAPTRTAHTWRLRVAGCRSRRQVARPRRQPMTKPQPPDRGRVPRNRTRASRPYQLTGQAPALPVQPEAQRGTRRPPGARPLR